MLHAAIQRTKSNGGVIAPLLQILMKGCAANIRGTTAENVEPMERASVRLNVFLTQSMSPLEIASAYATQRYPNIIVCRSDVNSKSLRVRLKAGTWAAPKKWAISKPSV